MNHYTPDIPKLRIYFSADKEYDQGFYEIKKQIREAIRATLYYEEIDFDTELSVMLCSNDYIKELNIDLTLSGHAHGGQIRILGQGLIAPGQGFFPKYTSGMYDGRLIVSRGLANNAPPIPRLFNRKELIFIEFYN